MNNSNLKELENLINNSPIFVIDRAENEILYDKILYNNFLINLKDYCEAVYSKAKFEKYNGMDFWETVEACLANFKPDEGNFLNYFNRAFSTRMKSEEKNEMIDSYRHGIKVNKRIEQIIVILDKYLDAHNWDEDIDLGDRESRVKISKALNIPIKLIEEAICTKSDTAVIGSYFFDSEGEGVNPFDFIPSPEYNALDRMTQIDGIKTIFDKIENEFKKIPASREKRKKVFSLFITRQLLSAWDICDELYISENGYSFIDGATLRYYKETEELPLDKWLAEECGIKPESFSRIKSEIEEFLKEILI